MWKFTKELSNELQAYPLENPLNIEGFCFHIGKLHHELVRMPEENAAALLNHFSSLRELLDFYSAGEGLRPVLPAEPVQDVQVQPVQDAVTLRTAYVWRQPEDEENLAQLPDGPSSLVFSLEDTQEKDALESLLLKRIAARRVPAFCFALDYALADGTHARAEGEIWRCLPGTLQPLHAWEFSTARVVAEYRLMGSAPAMRACQQFAGEYLSKMNALKRVHLDI